MSVICHDSRSSPLQSFLLPFEIFVLPPQGLVRVECAGEKMDEINEKSAHRT